MKIKLDENLPATLAPALAAIGHDADTVPDEGLGGRPDADIWAAAIAADRYFITQDLDFSDRRLFAAGLHPGLLLVRLRLPSQASIVRRVMSVFRAEDVGAWRGRLAIVTETKVRLSPR